MRDNRREAYYQEYQRGVSYKNNISLYDTVKVNENFYVGRQWVGLNAPDIEKPVLNILGRVVSYLISVLVGERIGVRAEVISNMNQQEVSKINSVITSEIEAIFEQNNLVGKAKDLVRNMAVDGDACMHLYFNPKKNCGYGEFGAVEAEIIENTNVFFGNPSSSDKETQPYILISSRVPLSSLKDEMKARGAKEAEINRVVADSSTYLDSFDDGLPKVNVITRYEKREGRIYVSRFTKTATIIDDALLDYTRYPISFMSWTKVKHSFHGEAALSNMIPNQIAINKLLAIAIKYQKELGLHKLLYDRTKIDNISNEISAIAVNGDPTTAIFRPVHMPEIPASIFTLIDRMIAYTRDMMGASDAALGNVRPDNASAIITVIESTKTPLVLQKRELMEFYEEMVRIIVDIISVDYGVRKICYKNNHSEFDFEILKEHIFKLNVDAGEGSFYSESQQIATLDSLFRAGVIKDAELFIESIPSGYLPNKTKILNSLSEQEEVLAKDSNKNKGGEKDGREK